MENKLTIKDSSIAFFTSFLFCQLGVVVFACFGIIIVSMFNISSETFFNFLNTAIGSLLTALVMDLIMVLIFFTLNKNKDNKIFNKPNYKKILIYIGIAIACYLLLYPVVNVVNKLIYKIGFPPNGLKYQLTIPNYLISIVSMAILPAIAEELLFRGLIFKGLQKQSNVFAILISAGMFSLFHMSLEQTIYPFLMGLLLSVIMCYENNIIYCIIVHFLNNIISLTLAYFNINLIFNHWTYYLLAIVFAIIFISTIVFVIINIKKQATKSVNKEDKIYFAVCLSIMVIIWIIIQIASIVKI